MDQTSTNLSPPPLPTVEATDNRTDDHRASGYSATSRGAGCFLLRQLVATVAKSIKLETAKRRAARRPQVSRPDARHGRRGRRRIVGLNDRNIEINSANVLGHNNNNNASSSDPARCHPNQLLNATTTSGRRRRPTITTTTTNKTSSPISQLLSINLIFIFTTILFVFIHANYSLLIPAGAIFVQASPSAVSSLEATGADLHYPTVDLDDPSSLSFGLRNPTSSVTQSGAQQWPSTAAVPQWAAASNLLLDSSASRSAKFRYELAGAGSAAQPPRLAAPTGSRTRADISSRSSDFISSKHGGYNNKDNNENNDRLASIHSQISELRRQLELELSLERRQLALGSPCYNATDCSNSIARSHCELDNFTCACLPHHVQYNSTTCLPPSLLGYECLIDAQCQRKVSNSYCSSAGVCDCQSKFVAYRKDKCLPGSKIDDYCLNDRQCQLADKHSHCKWKIYNVYGHCKCPPNYKQVALWNNGTSTPANGSIFHLEAHNNKAASTTTSQQEIRCAPRLGDSCFDTDECRSGTQNSVCRESRASDKLLTIWRSSGASQRKCYCAQGYSESLNKLECRANAAPATTTHNSLLDDATGNGSGGGLAVLALSAPHSMNSKHHYEFVIAPANQTTPAEQNSQEFDIRTSTADHVTAPATTPLSSSTTERFQHHLSPTQATAARIQPSPPPPPPPTTTTTTVATSASNITRKPTTHRPTTAQQGDGGGGNSATSSTGSGSGGSQQQKRKAPHRASSLGKPCSSKSDCQIRDKHSDCIGGLCECIRPTSTCSANSTGCHKDTFQCRNGQCISWYFVCDQFPNCDDGSDEDECRAHSCPPEAFQCDSGACLARGKLCNGKRDCADGSDERQCSSSVAAAATRVTAATGEAPVGKPESAASSAAATCHPRAFSCDNGQCLPAYVFCNAVEDCADGSDENERVCERAWPKRKWQPPISGAAAAGNNRTTAGAHLPANNATISGGLVAARLSLANHQPHPLDSPVVRSDKAAMDRLLAAAMAARKPDGRGHRLLLPERAQQPDGGPPDIRRRRAPPGAPRVDRRQCPKTAFTCRNGKCRSSAILCSGVDGCGDNSDEDRCEVCKCAAP